MSASSVPTLSPRRPPSLGWHHVTAAPAGVRPGNLQVEGIVGRSGAKDDDQHYRPPVCVIFGSAKTNTFSRPTAACQKLELNGWSIYLP